MSLKGYASTYMKKVGTKRLKFSSLRVQLDENVSATADYFSESWGLQFRLIGGHQQPLAFS
jgi:hypothetical protein